MGTGERPLLTCYEPQQSGLPTAIGSHHCKPLAPCEGGTNIGEQLCVTIMCPSHILEGEQGLFSLCLLDWTGLPSCPRCDTCSCNMRLLHRCFRETYDKTFCDIFDSGMKIHLCGTGFDAEHLDLDATDGLS